MAQDNLSSLSVVRRTKASSLRIKITSQEIYTPNIVVFFRQNTIKTWVNTDTERFNWGHHSVNDSVKRNLKIPETKTLRRQQTQHIFFRRIQAAQRNLANYFATSWKQLQAVVKKHTRQENCDSERIKKNRLTVRSRVVSSQDWSRACISWATTSLDFEQLPSVQLNIAVRLVWARVFS